MSWPISETWSHFLDYGVITSLAEFAARENAQLYFVGGTVRDLLLGREIEDLDFAVSGPGGASGFVRKFADLAGGIFIPLDEEHDTARVVFRNGGLYMDFSGIRGADITTDLAARDFTINAMAIDIDRVLDDREMEIIDPLGGMKDLNNRLIRLASAQSIRDDPVRMLRAYRFSAVFGFTIHPETSAAIQRSVGLLNSISSERVRDELFKILAVDKSTHCIKEMDDAGLLEQVFPEIIPMKRMGQNEYHHLDVWGHSMLTLEFFEQDPTPDSMKNYRSEVENYLNQEPVKGRSRRSLLKLAALLHDVGKPATRTMSKDGRVRFFHHNTEGAEIIFEIGSRLRLATRESSSLSEVVNGHMYPIGLNVFLSKPGDQKEKGRAMRRFIQKTGPEWLAILLLSCADLRATQGPWRKADELENLFRLTGEIADMYFQKARSPRHKLVTGDDLMAEFNLPPSPIIGQLLKQVEEAQAEGKIRTRDEAIELIRKKREGR